VRRFIDPVEARPKKAGLPTKERVLVPQAGHLNAHDTVEENHSTFSFFSQLVVLYSL
jgi:hypothetical protein